MPLHIQPTIFTNLHSTISNPPLCCWLKTCPFTPFGVIGTCYLNVANLLRGKTRQSVPDVAAHRLGQDEAYLTVRDILAEASTVRPELTAEGGRRWCAITRAQWFLPV
jgi:hypothetical protein